VLRFLVLLKHGTLEVVACGEDDIFRLARSRDAGICGVFDDAASARSFVATQEQFLAPPVERAFRTCGGA
jgi:hypothetical protein